MLASQRSVSTPASTASRGAPPGRTVVAPWQEYWYDDQFGKRGPVGSLLDEWFAMVNEIESAKDAT